MNEGNLKDLWSYSFIDQTWTQNETFLNFRPLQSYAYISFEYNFNHYFCIYGGSYYNNEPASNLLMYKINRLNLTNLVWELLITVNCTQYTSCYIGYYSNSIYLGYTNLSILSASIYNLDNKELTLISDQIDYSNQTFFYNETWYYLSQSQQNRVISITSSSLLTMQNLRGWNFELINDTIVIFGYTVISIIEIGNSIIIKNFETNEDIYSADNYLQPYSRISSSLTQINSILCVFGGYDNKMYYNDLWTFDITVNLWNYVIYRGTSPSARANHAAVSTGDLLIIFGGETEFGLTNDMFIYNLLNNSWTEIIPNSINIPSPRKGSCITFNISVAYIFGGENYLTPISELWKYDFIKNSYTLISTFPGSLTPSTCQIINDAINIYGGYQNSLLNGNSFYYNITDNSWNILNKCYCGYQGFCMTIGNVILSIGGERDYHVDSHISCTGIHWEFEYNVLSWLAPVASGFTYFQSKLFIFSGAAYNAQYMCNFFDTFSNFVSLDIWDLFSIYPKQCSSGTYLSDFACLFCPMGTYKEEYNNATVCSPCGAGKFNPKTGSNSKKQCYPCFTGTYNEDIGASLCLDCPRFYKCDAGTYLLKKNITSFANLNIQPLKYSSKDYSQQIFDFQMIFGFFILGLMIFGLLIYSNHIAKFDMFISSHSYQLNFPIILVKNRLGGIFSIIFIVSSIILVTTAVLSYLLQNIDELKLLQPLPILRNEVDQFSADIQIIAEFENYGDVCELNLTCPSKITVNAYNFEFLNQSNTCFQADRSCFVSFICTNCVIGPEAYIQFAFESTYSYASAINVNVMSTSSIPESNSSVYSSLKAQYNQVYSGPTDSSFYFLITPSLFISYVPDFKSNITGYHITENSAPSPGSIFYVEEIANSFRLGLSIYLTQSDSGLYTERYHIQNFSLLAGSILGSIAGILGASRSIMTFFESNHIKFIERKKNSKASFFDLTSQRKMITTNFIASKRKMIITNLEMTDQSQRKVLPKMPISEEKILVSSME